MAEAEVTDIMSELRKDHARINKATTALVDASQKLDGWLDPDTGEVVKGVRTRWQEAHDDELIELEERYLFDEKRLPASDIRAARVTKAIREKHPDLYAEFLALDSTVTILQRTISSRKVAIGAAQSVLRGERG